MYKFHKLTTTQSHYVRIRLIPELDVVFLQSDISHC